MSAQLLDRGRRKLLANGGTTLDEFADGIGLPVALVIDIIGASSGPTPTVEF